VLSWLLLRGRCRDCGEPISVRYPIVEATTAALFVATAFVIEDSWTLPAYWWFVGVCVALTLTDQDHKRIPNRILFPGIAGGAVLLTIGAVADGSDGGGGIDALLRSAAGAATYFGLLFVLAVIARGGFGFGDVKLAILLGMFMAYQSWAVLFAGVFLAFLIGGLLAVGLLLSRRKGRKEAIPFGPSLIAGAFVAIAVGEQLVDWYTGL
jgi:leader peptidase (prepilin peptidase)/N-methyltransferase